MTNIRALLPDHEILLALEPEELAGYVLQSLEGSTNFHVGNIVSLDSLSSGYSRDYAQKIAYALTEAFAWLQNEGLIADKPESSSAGWKFVTRRGQKLKTHIDVDAYRKANLLPRALLHPTILKEVWSDFLRGDYDSAVFKAFKEVEVEVRNAGKYSPTDLGVDLMRRAFHPDTGPLTDKIVPKPEQDALSSLFAGAIGSYKNPSSHRHVSIDANEAIEMIMLANHLLRIVDSRK